MSKFKVDDKVRVIDEEGAQGVSALVENGQIGIVVNVTEYDNSVKFGDGYGPWSLSDEHIELVEDNDA